MIKFVAFFKKEILADVRNYKIILLSLTFIAFAIMNPFLAKYTPEIMNSVLADMDIEIPEPTILDSWVQFYKNLGTLIIVFIIAYGGILVNEIKKGTLINMLTKGLTRRTVILTKFLYVALSWTIIYFTYFIVSYLYTILLFDGEVYNTFLAVFSYYIFGIFLISSLLLGSVIFKNFVGVLLFVGGIYMFLMLTAFIPTVGDYTPIVLGSINPDLMSNTASTSDIIIPMVITIVLASLFILFSVVKFNKAKI